MNESLCPLCGKANQCAMELEKITDTEQAPCWCTDVDFSADLLSRLPAQARGVACICPSCATQSTGNLRSETLSG